MARSVTDMVEELRLGFEDKLKARGKTFADQVRKAGRHLPHRVRREATFLAQSVKLTENPKLARMVDPARAKEAYLTVRDYLDAVDLAAARKTAVINMIASIAFALLVTGALVLTVLVLRGFV